jgi:putative hemin transport protein
MNTATPSTSGKTSAQMQWLSLRTTDKPPRIRDAAAMLGVSELELLLSGVGKDVQWLSASPADTLRAIESFGYVMALTRNTMCVHERKGVYSNIEISPYHMLVVGSAIDLRLFPKHWQYMLAIEHETSRGKQQSIQVFNSAGVAMHKVYLTASSNAEAFDTFVYANLATNQPTIVAFEETPKSPSKPIDSIDSEGLLAGWKRLADTHDFFPLLRRYGVSRIQSMSIAENTFTKRVSNNCLLPLFQYISQNNVPIMCFVGNDGSIQIHSGFAKNIVEIPGWINIMDTEFNLHVKISEVDSVWLVTKPSNDGEIHSVEAYTADGDLSLQLFGKRKPGVPELQEWLQCWNFIGESYA